MIAAKVTSYFSKLAKKLMSEKAKEELYNYLSLNPDAGDIIQGTGGVRRLRWKSGKDNKGKSGGVRIVYYYELARMVILITLYAKKDKENLSQSERNELKKIIPSLVTQFKEE